MEVSPPASPHRSGHTMACLEMELELELELDHSECLDHDSAIRPLTSSYYTPGKSQTLSPMVELASHVVAYMKLWVQVYPRTSLLVGSLVGVVVLVCSVAIPWRHYAAAKDLERNHLEVVDYSLLETDYSDFKAQIHHWCLFGGNDNCPTCLDPTVGQSREEVPGWSNAHNRNKLAILQASQQQSQSQEEIMARREGGLLDVVFVGDQTFQAWGDGRFLDKTFSEGPQIAAYFNQTFRTESLQGLSLGISTDRASNLLWRLQHGEMPPTLQAKVWWLLIGASDLALSMCSEDVTVLGILRIAEELAYHHPHSKIVIQALLPRSNHRDGSLHMTDDKRGSTFRNPNNNNKAQNADNPYDDTNVWSFRTNNLQPHDMDPGHSKISSALEQAQQQAKQPYFDYYIWPSILAINAELETFCTQHHQEYAAHEHAHDQFVYFNADDLLVESVAPDGKEKRIRNDLMPNSILLSYQGHQVLMDAVQKKLQELLSNFDKDKEGNDNDNDNNDGNKDRQ